MKQQNLAQRPTRLLHLLRQIPYARATGIDSVAADICKRARDNFRLHIVQVAQSR